MRCPKCNFTMNISGTIDCPMCRNAATEQVSSEYGYSRSAARCAEWVVDRREMKKLRKSLKALVSACEQSISALDAEMKKPSTPERGGRVAKITNFLELQKDMSKIFGLGD